METTSPKNDFHKSIEAMSSMLPDQQRKEAILILLKDVENPELLLDAILNDLNGNEIFQKRFDKLGIDQKNDLVTKFKKSFRTLGVDIHNMIISSKYQEALSAFFDSLKAQIMLSQTLSSCLVVNETDKEVDLEVALIGNTVKSTLSVTNNSSKPVLFKMALCYKRCDITDIDYASIKNMRSPLLISLHNEEAKMMKPVRLEKKGLFANAYNTMKQSVQGLLTALDAFHKSRSHSSLVNGDQWLLLLDNFTEGSKEFTEHTVVQPMDTFILDVNGFKSRSDSQFFLLIEAQSIEQETEERKDDQPVEELKNEASNEKDNS